VAVQQAVRNANGDSEVVKMPFIRVHRKIDAETLHLPEPQSMMGQTVEVTVREKEAAANSVRNWQPLIDAAGKDLIDPDVYKRYREFDRQQNVPAAR
jgi:hypothetical protein